MNTNTDYRQRVALNHHDLLRVSFLKVGTERKVLERIGDKVMHAVAQKRNS